MTNKIIGQVYVNVLQDENGEIKYAWGYDLDYNERVEQIINETDINILTKSIMIKRIKNLKDKSQEVKDE